MGVDKTSEIIFGGKLKKNFAFGELCLQSLDFLCGFGTLRLYSTAIITACYKGFLKYYPKNQHKAIKRLQYTIMGFWLNCLHYRATWRVFKINEGWLNEET